MRNSTAILVLGVAALLGTAVGVLRVRRHSLEESAAARERAAAAHLAEVGDCLRLLDWTLLPSGEDGAVVRAHVLPGRDGRVALDAHGGRGAEDVLVPELQMERLVPVVVTAGVPVLLERRLRRVRRGDVEEMALRFSCRPPGPRGSFGVIEYNSTTVAEAPDGYGNLLRPLPPQAH